MRRASYATGIPKNGQLRRPDSPITSGLSWNHVEVVVRHFLTAIDSVVLEIQYAQRLIQANQCDGDSLRGPDDGRCFVVV